MQGTSLAAAQFGGTYYVYHLDGTVHIVALTDKNDLVTDKYAYSYRKVLDQVQALCVNLIPYTACLG